MTTHSIKLALVLGGVLHKHLSWHNQQLIEKFEQKHVKCMPQSYLEFRDCIDELNSEFGIDIMNKDNLETLFAEYLLMVKNVEGVND